MAIKNDMQRKAEQDSCIVWAGIWLMMLYCMMYSTGCTGFKMCASLNQIDEISDTQKLSKKQGQ